eukprot:6201341-Pleurochrysis_carterae.AAC.1
MVTARALLRAILDRARAEVRRHLWHDVGDVWRGAVAFPDEHRVVHLVKPQPFMAQAAKDDGRRAHLGGVTRTRSRKVDPHDGGVQLLHLAADLRFTLSPNQNLDEQAREVRMREACGAQFRREKNVNSTFYGARALMGGVIFASPRKADHTRTNAACASSVGVSGHLGRPDALRERLEHRVDDGLFALCQLPQLRVGRLHLRARRGEKAAASWLLACESTARSEGEVVISAARSAGQARVEKGLRRACGRTEEGWQNRGR